MSAVWKALSEREAAVWPVLFLLSGLPSGKRGGSSVIKGEGGDYCEEESGGYRDSYIPLFQQLRSHAAGIRASDIS